MIQPVDFQDFFIAFFSSALVICAGALYALFFAFARLLRRRTLDYAAYGSYGVLAVNIFILARVLHLDGFWQLVVWTMLAGYLFAPRAIWQLCRATHSDVDAAAESPAIADKQRLTT